MRVLLSIFILIGIHCSAQSFCWIEYPKKVSLVKITRVDSIFISIKSEPTDSSKQYVALSSADKDYIVGLLNDTTNFRNASSHWYPEDIRLYIWRGYDLDIEVFISEKTNSISIGGRVDKDYEGGPNEWQGQMSQSFREKFADLFCKMNLRR